MTDRNMQYFFPEILTDLYTEITERIGNVGVMEIEGRISKEMENSRIEELEWVRKTIKALVKDRKEQKNHDTEEDRLVSALNYVTQEEEKLEAALDDLGKGVAGMINYYWRGEDPKKDAIENLMAAWKRNEALIAAVHGASEPD